MRSMGWVLALMVACSGDTATKDGMLETDLGADTGTDDTDPTTTAVVSATGTWVGNCSGDFTSTSSSYTYTGVIDADSTLDLVDTDGAVDGDWNYTLNYTSVSSTYSSGYRVSGTRDEAHLMLTATGYTSTSSSTTYFGYITFDLTIDGDTATGDLILEQYGVQHHFPCEFAR